MTAFHVVAVIAGLLATDAALHVVAVEAWAETVAEIRDREGR